MNGGPAPTTPYRILLVDDDCEAVDTLAALLQHEGFEARTAYTGEDSLLEIEAHPPDLIVLDIRLPGMDGRAVCRELRSRGDRTPVILLTGLNAISARIDGLEDGADDYLGKPFDPYELIARIRAVLRRGHAAEPGTALVWHCRSRGLQLDRRPGRRAASLDSRRLALTPKALDLLEYLMAHADQDLGYAVLLRDVWRSTLDDRDTLKVRIGELRHKLGDDPDRPRFIVTLSGVGYRFIGPVEGEP